MKLTHLLILVGTLSFLGCSSNTKKNETTDIAKDVIYERMNVPEFQTKLAAVSNPQLVDVRTPKEFANGNIEGAVNINIKSNDFLQNISKLDKEQPVFVYCQVGGRSQKCAEKMKSLGFSEIYELKPGYSGWEQ